MMYTYKKQTTNLLFREVVLKVIYRKEKVTIHTLSSHQNVFKLNFIHMPLGDFIFKLSKMSLKLGWTVRKGFHMKLF